MHPAFNALYAHAFSLTRSDGRAASRSEAKYLNPRHKSRSKYNHAQDGLNHSFVVSVSAKTKGRVSLASLCNGKFFTFSNNTRYHR